MRFHELADKGISRYLSLLKIKVKCMAHDFALFNFSSLILFVYSVVDEYRI